MRLRLRKRTLELEAGRPVLMGVVNATPESLSDGGGLPDDEARIAHGIELAI